MNKKLHQFAACDNYHPASEDIYLVSDVLDYQLKLVGHALDLEFVILFGALPSTLMGD